jgi:hypothetical protein
MKCVFCLLISILSVATSYSQGKNAEPSHYLFPEFTNGVVLMKSGTTYEAFINYNSLTEEMVFENKGKKFAMDESKLASVDTIFVKERKFVIVNNKFFELLLHSKSDLYAEHKSSVTRTGTPAAYGGTSQTSATTTYSSLNTGNAVYELNLPEDYKVELQTCYWLNKNGELNKFTNMKQLMKLYEDREDMFKAYVKKNNVKFNNQESIIQLIQYLETN